MTERKDIEQDQTERYFDEQFDDEEVQFMFRKHPIVMRKGFIVSALVTLVGPLVTLTLAWVRPESAPSLNFFYISLLLSLAAAVVVFLPSWMRWHYSVYIVTDKRLVQKTQRGLFSSEMGDLGIGQIQTMTYKVDGIVESMMGFGTIVLQTYIGDLVISQVPKPAEIHKELASLLRVQGIDVSEPAQQDG